MQQTSPAETDRSAIPTVAVSVAGSGAIAFDIAMTPRDTVDPDVGTPTPEQLLLAVAQGRDRVAFTELFRHFAPRLKAYLMRLGAEAGAAEELAQEAMIMVWRRAETFDPAQASVGTWIFRIARNKRIDALRRERRPEFDPADPCLQPDPAPAADGQLERGQSDERVRQALRTLPPEQAEVVRMAYFEDKAHGTIAEETELPLGTVKSRLRLAMGRLRKALREESLES